MTTRSDVVQKISEYAFDAVAVQSVPEDITIAEQAEGLVSQAMRLRRTFGGCCLW
jgi:hypothetical protein